MQRAATSTTIMALSLWLPATLFAQQIATGKIRHDVPTVASAANTVVTTPVAERAPWMRNRDAAQRTAQHSAVTHPATPPVAKKVVHKVLVQAAPAVAAAPPARPAVVPVVAVATVTTSVSAPVVAPLAVAAPTPSVVAVVEPRPIKNLPDVAFASQPTAYYAQPRAIKRVPASLPDNLLSQLRAPADVLVRLDIAPDGHVRNATILDLPHPAWREEILKTAKQWEYAPLPSPTTAEVVFRILPTEQ